MTAALATLAACTLTTAAFAVVTRYERDAAGRLTGVLYADGTGAFFDYDASGNVLARRVCHGDCAMDGSCHAKGDVNPKNTTLVCDPAQSKTSWSVAGGGTGGASGGGAGGTNGGTGGTSTGGTTAGGSGGAKAGSGGASGGKAGSAGSTAHGGSGGASGAGAKGGSSAKGGSAAGGHGGASGSAPAPANETPASGDSGGCGCTVVGASGDGGVLGAAGVLGLAAAWAARRRRRRLSKLFALGVGAVVLGALPRPASALDLMNPPPAAQDGTATIQIVGIGNGAAITASGSGFPPCGALMTATSDDPSIASIDPPGPLDDTFQKFGVTGNKLGTTTVHIKWADDPPCNGMGEYDVRVVVTDYPKDPPPALTEGMCADPVSTRNGELVEHAIDLDLHAPLRFVFERFYSSGLAERIGSSGALGPNWRHNFESRLVVSGTSAVVLFDQGQVVAFSQSAPGSAWVLQSAPFIGYSLVQNGSTYGLFDPRSGLVYAYDGANGGRLASIHDLGGKGLDLAYTNGQLSSVGDAFGRSLGFVYQGDRLTSVTDHAGRIVSFGYANGALATVTDTMNGVTKYTITSAGNHVALLASTTAPDGTVVLSQTWDAQGRVATQSDAAGNVTTIAYDTPAAGQATVTDPLGHTSVYTYDGADLVAQKDEAGATAPLAYDGAHHATSVGDRMGATTSLVWTDGRLTGQTLPGNLALTSNFTATTAGGFTWKQPSTVTHPDGSTDVLGWGPDGQLASRTGQDGLTRSYTRDAKGQAISVGVSDGAQASFTYDGMGSLLDISGYGPSVQLTRDSLSRVVQRTFADGTSESFTWDAADHPTSFTDAAGGVTTYGWDANGRLASVKLPDGSTLGVTYSPTGTVASYVDQAGTSTSFQYDAYGRPTAIVLPTGSKLALGHDPTGGLSSITDGAGKAYSFTHDADGRLTATSTPLGSTRTYTFDTRGDVVQVATSGGKTVKLGYDAGGRVTSIQDPAGNVATFQYGAAGRLLSIALPGGPKASYSRDAAGWVTSITDGDGHARTFGYDMGGRVTAFVDGLGRQTSFARDARGRIATITYPDGVTETVTADPRGFVTKEAFSDGTVINRAPDALGRLVSATNLTRGYDVRGFVNASNGLASTRDALGRITKATLANGKDVTYAYDNRGRLATVTDWLGGVTTFTYDADGHVLSIARPNKTTTTFAYDADGDVTSIQDMGASGTFASEAFTRDANGWVVAADRTLPQALDTKALDATAGVQTFDAADQNLGFTYDARGRRTGGSATLVWDGASRLASATLGGATYTFSHDAEGRVTSLSDGTTTQSFVWNDAFAQPALSVVRQGAQDARYYITTPTGEILYAVDATAGKRSYFHYDEAGNTVALTDDGGAVTDAYAYSPGGVLLSATGSTPNPFVFAGRAGAMRLGDTSYYVMGERVYDAASQAFLSPDPTFDAGPTALNAYAYANDDPTRFVDPTGDAPASGAPASPSGSDATGSVTDAANAVASSSAVSTTLQTIRIVSTGAKIADKLATANDVAAEAAITANLQYLAGADFYSQTFRNGEVVGVNLGGYAQEYAAAGQMTDQLAADARSAAQLASDVKSVANVTGKVGKVAGIVSFSIKAYKYSQADKQVLSEEQMVNDTAIQTYSATVKGIWDLYHAKKINYAHRDKLLADAKFNFEEATLNAENNAELGIFLDAYTFAENGLAGLIPFPTGWFVRKQDEPPPPSPPATAISCGASGNDGKPCDDGNPCTTGDTCHGYVCQGKTVVCPQPTGPCQGSSYCDPSTGMCTQAKASTDGVPCNNPDLCMEKSVCMGGQCVGTPVTCTNPGPCETGPGMCKDGDCSYTPVADGTSCPGSNATQTCACASGACQCVPTGNCSAPMILDSDPMTGLFSDSSGGIGGKAQIAGEKLECGVPTMVTLQSASGTPVAAPVDPSSTPQKLVITVPDGVKVGANTITVTTGGGTATWPFMVTGYAPIVMNIQPNPATQGENVTITGTHLGGTAASVLFFSTWPPVAPTSGSDTSLVVPVPFDAMSGTVSVQTSGGYGYSPVPLMVQMPNPTIVDVQPRTLHAGDGFVVTGTQLDCQAANLTDTATGQYVQVNVDMATSKPPTELHFTAPVSYDTYTGPLTLLCNVWTAQSPFDVTLLHAPPQNVTFTPTTGAPGDVVKIKGDLLGDTNAVAFASNVAAQFTVQPDGSGGYYVSATVPAGAVSGPISVTNAGGTTVSTNAFTVVAKPKIVGFSPASAAAGADVWIDAPVLVPNASVQFLFTGSAYPTYPIDESDDKTTYVVNVPTDAITGPITLVVNGSNVDTTTTPFVVPGATLTSVTPMQGAPGDLVTVVGSGFGASPAGYYGSNAALELTNASALAIPQLSPSDTHFVVTVPEGAATGPVYVYPVGPQLAATSSTLPFTVLPQAVPVINGLSVSHGITGDVLTISGSGLGGFNANVTFVSGSYMPPAKVIGGDNASLQIAIPNADPGSYTVQLQTGAGTATWPTAFTVDPIAPPVVTGVSTTTTATYSTYTITGSNLGGAAATVTVGGATATVISGTQTSLLVASPFAASGIVTVSTQSYGGVGNGGQASSSTPLTVCAPNCGSSTCGDDGCGGSCGTCGAGTSCQPVSNGGTLQNACIPTTWCGAVGTAGCCVGSTHYYCQAGEQVAEYCASSCAWDSTQTAYTCDTGTGSDPSGTHPRLCPAF